MGNKIRNLQIVRTEPFTTGGKVEKVVLSGLNEAGVITGGGATGPTGPTGPSGGASLSKIISGGQWPILQGQWGYVTPNSSSSTPRLSGSGLFSSIGVVASGQTGSFIGNNPLMSMATSGGLNDQAYWQNDYNIIIVPSLPIFQFWGAMTNGFGNNMRGFIGFTTVQIQTQLAGFTGGVIGLEFDTALGDSGTNTYRVVHASAGNPATRLDTSIGLATYVVIEIEYVTTSQVEFRIYEGSTPDLSSLLYSTTITTNLPTGGTIRIGAGVQAQIAAQVSFATVMSQLNIPL